MTDTDDFPHAAPPHTALVWKENWVFQAVDTKQRVATLFHISLRPEEREGIFTAKFALGEWEHRYVGRSEVGPDLAALRPVANERLTFEVVEPDNLFHIVYEGDELDADVFYTARFPRYDFRDGPRAPGFSWLGDIGRCVFPYNHQEQALSHRGRIEIKAGPRAGECISIAGYASRDHSWGWRNDLAFREHHWICASFDDRFVEGSAMEEAFYPDGLKSGGWISTDDGNDPVVEVDTTDAYWTARNEPLPVLDQDVTYVIRTHGGQSAAVKAHISTDYGQLYLNARAPDGTQVYQDVQIFCDYTLVDTGQPGSGVLEIGKFIEGANATERTRRSASRA